MINDLENANIEIDNNNMFVVLFSYGFVRIMQYFNVLSVASVCDTLDCPQVLIIGYTPFLHLGRAPIIS